MKAMVFAAGLGTRLKPFTDSHPKALALVNGKPLLEHVIRYLQKAGITEVVVNVHHFADQIEAVLERENGFGSRVQISDERTEVLETGGGLLKAIPLLQGSDPVLILNVDVFTNLDLSAMLASHQHRAADATLAVMQRTSSRYLLFDNDLRLSGWRNEKTGVEKLPRFVTELQPLAFSGVQLVSQRFLEAIPLQGKFSMIDAYLSLANELPIYGFDHTGDVFLDVGKPEALAQAARLLL
jgi:NDP-sugar pyrophosphorylase family protein